MKASPSTRVKIMVTRDRIEVVRVRIRVRMWKFCTLGQNSDIKQTHDAY